MLVFTLFLYLLISLVLENLVFRFVATPLWLSEIPRSLIYAALASAIALALLRLSRSLWEKEAERLKRALDVKGVRWIAFLTVAVIGGFFLFDLVLEGHWPTIYDLTLLVPIAVISLLNFLGVELPLPFVSEIVVPPKKVFTTEPPEIPTPPSSTEPSTAPLPPSTPVPGDSRPPTGDFLRKEYTFAYKEAQYGIAITAALSQYHEQRSRPRILDCTQWADEYVAGGITPEVRDVVSQLLKIRRTYGTFDDVGLVLAFVQSVVKYTADTGEYPRYPLESLVDEAGDCEDSSILGAALLKLMDYDVALLILPSHAALGVAGVSDLPGAFVQHEGVNYYYCEMTAQGWKFGELPEKYESSKVNVLKVRLRTRKVETVDPNV